MNRFKMVRLTAGLTQQALARAAAISESKVSKIETGRQDPDRELKKRLAGIMNRPVGDIFPVIATGSDGHPGGDLAPGVHRE